jgi:ferrous iron transport protein B
MKLTDLSVGHKAYIRSVTGDPAFVRRLEEMGFVVDVEIKTETTAPMSDPMEFMVKGSSITLRRSEAEHIEVEAVRSCCASCHGCALHHCEVAPAMKNAPRQLLVALIGNPNCGKTTLFNQISGGHEREGNYCGVTVDSKEGRFTFHGTEIRLVDLPGTYSLASFSPEEKYVEQYLQEHRPDVIINVLDATNLQRNLFLTTQLFPLGIPMVAALNMYDELREGDKTLDVEELSRRLGVTCVPTDSRSGRGLEELFRTVCLAPTKEYAYPVVSCAEHNDAASHFNFVDRTLEGIYRPQTEKERATVRLDHWATHKVWGFPIFFLILFLMFQVTYTLGDYPMQWIDAGVGALGDLMTNLLPEGWLRDLVVDGVIGGVGGVIVFLPNILILYACISLLEDSGYMARAAYIMDRLMRSFGLHGKSFIPMIMGFGCNVPAVMSTRMIENRKNRLVTMLVTPFMSCSARLPVYLVLAGALFPGRAGLVLFGLYVLGIVVAILSAKLLNAFLPNRDNRPFMMELPNYRLPLWKSVVRHTWERGRQYLHKMSHIILLASIVVWALSYFPNHDAYETPQEQQEASYLGQLGHFVEPVFAPMGTNWKMNVGLISGVGAKEIVVSTLGVLYSGEEVDTDDEAQTSQLASQLAADLTPLAALSFLVFTLLYFPCIATIAAIRREANHWGWAVFAAVYTTGVAWCLATLVYQVGSRWLGA